MSGHSLVIIKSEVKTEYVGHESGLTSPLSAKISLPSTDHTYVILS